MKRLGLHRIYQKLRGGELTLGRTTGSVALGLFVGLLPLYGLHLPLCLGLSVWLGLDGLVAYAAANISNPLLAPFIVMLEIEVGSLLFTGQPVAWDLAQVKAVGFASLTTHSIVGALIVAIIGAATGALVTLALGFVWRKRRDSLPPPVAAALLQTQKRYAGVRAQDRHYVRIKLKTDPLTKQLAAIEHGLGHVTDAGCGRGQFSLFLFELERASSVYGFDWDRAKVVTATQAAGTVGQYVVGDLRDPPLVQSDTVLLFDVLHYLPASTQRQLLSRIYDCLRPGGRLLLRDIDKNSGFTATFTRLFEHIGTWLGMNRAEHLAFRSATTIRDELLSLGFLLESNPDHAQRATQLLDNELCIYRKPPAKMP